MVDTFSEAFSPKMYDDEKKNTLEQMVKRTIKEDKGMDKSSKIMLGLVIAVAIIILYVLILKYAWNESIPKIFPSTNKITFTTAFALLIVMAILFGKF